MSFILFSLSLTGYAYFCRNTLPMKQRFLILAFLMLLTGCKKEVKPADISKINGYWEIEKAILPNGESKEYKINETIDYFSLANGTGFRKKVMPQLDGKYLENGHAEQLKVKRAGDKVYLEYTTECCTWKEELLEITDSVLVLKNDQKLEYHYKRPIPFTVK